MPADPVEEWLSKAEEDERALIILKTAGGPWSPAAYHAQQAAEKYIKAVLVAGSQTPRKTHDLLQLLSLYTGTPPPPAVETAASMLSAFAWFTQYPGGPVIDEHPIAQAEADLAEIKAWSYSETGRGGTP